MEHTSQNDQYQDFGIYFYLKDEHFKSCLCLRFQAERKRPLHHQASQRMCTLSAEETEPVSETFWSL
jgi:hypothetical protein